MRLIDADKLKEEIGECPENWLDSPEEMQAVDDWKGIMELIDAAPTVKERTGTWSRYSVNGVNYWCCNKCDILSLRSYNYCYSCGAKMMVNRDRTWRNDPVTKKQLETICAMCEEAAMNNAIIPKFTGTTKGEANDWIDKYKSEIHYSTYDPHEDAGDRV